MSWQIQIHKAKPNPQGKDKPRYGQPDQAQLLAEWVDLKNIGDAGVSLSRLHLAHIEFDEHGQPKQNPTIYWNGPASDTLMPGKTVRVHTGKSSGSAQMHQTDRVGPDLHSYAERTNFALNNKNGDTLSVWWRTAEKEWKKEDQAPYDPNPAEGAIQVRQGAKLVPAAVLAVR